MLTGLFFLTADEMNANIDKNWNDMKRKECSNVIWERGKPPGKLENLSNSLH